MSTNFHEVALCPESAVYIYTLTVTSTIINGVGIAKHNWFFLCSVRDAWAENALWQPKNMWDIAKHFLQALNLVGYSLGFQAVSIWSDKATKGSRNLPRVFLDVGCIIFRKWKLSRNISEGVFIIEWNFVHLKFKRWPLYKWWFEPFYICSDSTHLQSQTLFISLCQ